MTQQYTLKLSFDLRQVTQSLAYEFVQKGNSNYPMEGDGPLAGTFNFQQGDEIFVEVVVAAPNTIEPDIFMSDFAVTDCTLVSIPARMTEYLSLFHKRSACAVVNGWGKVQPIPLTPEDERNHTRRFSTVSAEALPVSTKNGQWQISGYLSVQLPPGDNTPLVDGTRHQLYFFDPEGSSGYGGGFGP